MLDHLAIQCTDVAASASFYDAVLAPLGGQRVLDFGEAIGYGVPPMPDFWIGRQTTGEGFRESHIAFSAPDRASVRAFFEAATALGAAVLRCCTSHGCGWNTTQTTTGPSSATLMATTSRPCVTCPSRGGRLARTFFRRPGHPERVRFVGDC